MTTHLTLTAYALHLHKCSSHSYEVKVEFAFRKYSGWLENLIFVPILA